MVRNVILLVSTVAVMLLLFVGYTSLVGQAPRPGDHTYSDPAATLPKVTPVADEHKLSVQGVTVDPGRDMAYISYDPITGRPDKYFKAHTWEKVPGTQNELLVIEPELMMRLPSGMIITITADRGQIKAEWISRKDALPKFGWLEGDARLVIDRETGFDRTPLSERPQDRITIEMQRLEFDLDLGELKTTRSLLVTSPEFEIAGTGLHLIWNQADNRVEKLLIENGGRMVLEGGLLNSLDGEPERDGRAGERAPVTRPAAHATPGKNRKLTAYRCVFTGGVTVDHYVGDQRHGGLLSDELTLLFDVGGRGRGLASRASTTTAPAGQPDSAPPRRIVVKWDGRLALAPAKTLPGLERPRRRVEARGRPVTATLPNGEVRCSRLVLHEDARRLWLYPTESGLVELCSETGLSVGAASMFADLERNIVKLIGDVRFQSSTRAGQAARAITIGCNLWAELHLGRDFQPDQNTVEDAFDNPLASRPPESAVFVGDVRVNFQDRMLTAHRLDAYFHRSADPGAPAKSTTPGAGPGRAREASLQTALESVVATGDVRLTLSEEPARNRWQRVLKRHSDVVKRALLSALSRRARSAARARAQHEQSTLECAALRLDFAPESGAARVREMHGTGAVAIYDRHGRFAARGREVAATFVAGQTGEELERATVTGSSATPARVRARAYTLHGRQISVDNLARSLHVDGSSALTFRSRRSLQGLTRVSAEPITVTSTESMHVDEPRNTVYFIGEVVAGTGDERLLADTLTLLLEDADHTPEPTGWARAAATVRALRQRLTDGQAPAQEPRALFGVQRSPGGDRKELARVLARNATMQSETFVPGDTEPLVHQSVTAPEIRIDVRQRCVRTQGETALLMTDRRLGGGSAPARPALGLPSALVDRGPSQTAMSCLHGLTYMLGEEGPRRRDSVLLQGGVKFVHVTGREMADLERMLPQIKSDPSFFRSGKIRNRHIELECGRLEVVFAVPDVSGGAQAALGIGPSLELSLFHATESVFLSDRQDAVVREVYAHQLEFDRPSRLIRVLGRPSMGINARIYEENLEAGHFSMPAEGPEFIIDLETNTIRAKQIRGRVGR